MTTERPWIEPSKLDDLTVEYEHFIGIDRYDAGITAYALFRKVGEKIDVLLAKTSVDNIDDEINNLAFYFNAKILRTV